MASALPESLFRLIVDRTAVPFVVVDRDGDIQYASSSITELAGWAADELVGHNMLEFIDPDQVDAAVEGLAEVGGSNQDDAGIPIVFALRNRSGGWSWVEVAAMPFFDHPEMGLIALRLRSWEAQRHLSEFLHRLLADAPLADVLASLTRSITATLHGLGAAVHHGFDGERFVGVTGSWDGAAGLPLVGAPWVDAVGAKGVLQATADHDSAASLGATSCWLTPISVTSLPPAVLSVWTHLREAPLLGHRNALAEAAGYVELALVRTAEHQRLLHLAGHDSLTGVANRASFLDRLAEDLAIGEADLAVAFCDLDGFKQINDSYGHGTGDDVLVQVADRLRATLRAGDELARMGGDEFTVVWRGVSDEVAAEQVAQRLLAAVREPFTVPHGTVKLGLSVGIALATPGATADSLLSAADTALYQSKKAGGARSTIRR